MHKILFVEDVDTIRDSYTELLQDEGFKVTAVADSVSALQTFDSTDIDLVILDITLGDDADAGFNLCTKIRSLSETIPIIFLTSHDSEFDKISGMRLGADDYLTKDISIDYLLVRIKALLRRMDIINNRVKETTNELKRGDLVINLDTISATWKEQPLNLNVTQIWMLYDLAHRKNHVRSIQQLMNAAKTALQTNTVAIHLMNIRKAFQAIDADFDLIKNERGVGYRWNEQR